MPLPIWNSVLTASRLTMGPDCRIMAIAAASGRVGFILLIGNAVVDRGLSRKASTGPSEAATYAAERIEQLRPDVVVTEKVPARSRKSAKTRAVIDAITAVADLADVLNIAVVRGRSHDNRFAEAADLALRYPEMQRCLPKIRRPWEAEPKTLMYFEAMSLIESAFGQPAGGHQT